MELMNIGRSGKQKFTKVDGGLQKRRPQVLFFGLKPSH